MKKRINCSLIGFGTVGSGVYRLLKDNDDIIKSRTNIDIQIKSICDIRAAEIGEVDGIPIIEDWRRAVSDESIDTVIELIGGIEPAKSIIMESLRNGKNVVTANKKLLAEEGFDIFELESRVPVKLGFEASVGGGIPCVLSLKSGLTGNRIRRVIGILNGTTNYILTRMTEDGMSFERALRDAQEKGFAEADPTFDVDGYDAGHKISIMSMLAYNKKIHYSSIQIEGIRGIDEQDIDYARDMGYVIKLLGISRIKDGAIDIRVHPAMLSVTHPLASIRDEHNAIMFDGDRTGPVVLYGKGAGSMPTASAVVSDIIQIAQKKGVKENAVKIEGDADFITPDRRFLRFYLRIHVEDKSGILAKIAGVLGKNDISIESVLQKSAQARTHIDRKREAAAQGGDERFVPVIIMTHRASEDGIRKSIDEINTFDFVMGKVTLIRVEDSLDI